MNKEGLEAMLSIAKKQGWNGKPAEKVIVAMQFAEDMGMNLSDLDVLLYVTSTEGLQHQLDAEEEEEEYSQAMIEELAWYNHARMMGWE